MLTAIYQSLFKLSENADLARGEVLAATCCGRPIFLPGGLTRSGGSFLALRAAPTAQAGPLSGRTGRPSPWAAQQLPTRAASTPPVASRPRSLPRPCTGLPLLGRQGGNRLPWGEMGALATSVRRVARLLYGVVQALDSGFDAQASWTCGSDGGGGGLDCSSGDEWSHWLISEQGPW